MKTMASASAPIASRSRQAERTASSSTAVRIVPSANVRSGTSSRNSRPAIGVKSPQRPQVAGRSRRRISSASRNPGVVMMPIRAPLRSSSALVPTVVPCTMASSASDMCHRASGPSINPTASSPRLDGTLAVLKLLRALIKKSKIGEGAADIDAHKGCAVSHDAIALRSVAVAAASTPPWASTATP